MTDPLAVQYDAFNRRRLHYSLLFWSSLALQFSGVAILLLIDAPTEIHILGAISCLLMAFVAHRLHRQEEYYTQALRNIDASWVDAGVTGIQPDLPVSRFGSRKLVICALVGVSAFLLSDAYIF